MVKWYEQKEIDNEIAISSRVRLARNLKQFSFPSKISRESSLKLLKTVENATFDNSKAMKNEMKIIYLNEMNDRDKLGLKEKHIISPFMMHQKKPSAVIMKQDETLSVMVNEEDHIRIQSITYGMNLESAYDQADKLDSYLEEQLDYAFDPELGYLTSCPSNVGTGLRASFMLHLPVLTRASQIPSVMQSIASFGLVLRGMYGEGTESIASLYQISNQITLGLSEKEILNNLVSVAKQVIEKEEELQEKLYKENKVLVEDRVFRALGILQAARSISSKEASHLISELRVGQRLKIIDSSYVPKSYYHMIMDIQPANIQQAMDEKKFLGQRDVFRADYIRKLMND